MNPFAYRTAGYAMKAFSGLSRARFNIHGRHNIPDGAAIVFTVNHFTRIETLFLPYYLYHLFRRPIWSLADYHLFTGGLAAWLDRLGAVSTRDPDRDTLMVKTLLTGEAAWVVFPEGRMVKNKKIYNAAGKKGEKFVVASSEGVHAPHTGAATLALRTEFYRARIRHMRRQQPEEAERLQQMFGIAELAPVMHHETCIVPVNLTYYPLRAKENILSRLAERYIEDMSDRMREEFLTEGSMLFSGVDVDMHFGAPIRVAGYLKSRAVQADIHSPQAIGFDDAIASRSMLQKTAKKIMERYMSAIYDLTTVNHDHLMAGLLKHVPSARLYERDFRRRLYLATTTEVGQVAANRHSSLLANQIALLTDDRHGKIANFMDLAQEKNVIEKRADLLKIRMNHSADKNFHQARVDDPVTVMANEVEPLGVLNQKLKSIAGQPAVRIRYQLRKYLMEKGEIDFEKDYARFFVEGESKDKAVGAPFLIRGKSRGPALGILLVHGYMAAPLEVRRLAEYLGEQGHWVYVPRLKGHGTSPDDLATRHYMEWVESVEEGYIIIRNFCRHVVVGGFSTGAGLALDLCTRVDGIAGVFAISPPLKLQDFSARFVPAVNFWNHLMKKMNVEAAGKQFVENHPENPHINYTRNPLSAMMELDRLMRQLEGKIGTVDVPAMVIQSLADPVVDSAGAVRIFERLGARDKELLMVNTARHGIVNGDGADRVFEAVGAFVRRLRRHAV